MSNELYSLLDEQVELRAWEQERNEIEEMCRLYEGEIPNQFKKYFPKAHPEILIQVIGLAHDDLATQAGRLPDLRGEPRDLSKKEEKAAGMLEKIGFSYLRGAKPTGKLFMKDLAWWLQLGRATAIVTPDFDAQMPRFEVRDPRTCYPGVAEMTNNRITKLSDLIFKYEIGYHEAVQRKLAPEDDDKRDIDKVQIIEYIDDEKWCLASEHGQSEVAYHNLGMVPGHVFGSFTPNRKAGHNRFKDQVPLAVSISRLVTAKLSFADRITSNILWTRNYEGMVELGPDTIIRLGPQGEIGQIGPTQTLQVDQDIQMLNQFSRVLNRNPEVRQGEIAAKGTYTSAKTLEQLADAIDTVVGGDWDIIGPGMEYLFEVAFSMDVALWGDIEKTIQGNLRGKRFLDTYTPSKDIGDRRSIRVDYGFGVGGYQGFLMHLQAGDAGYMSRQTVMEAMPGIHDTATEQLRIDIENMDEAGTALFLQQAATGTMDMVLWAELRQKMAEDGMPMHEAIIEYQERLAEQAAAVQAQQSEQATLTTPTGEEGAPPEEELPGIPGQVLAGV